MENLREICWYGQVCRQECSDSCVRYNEVKYLMDSSGIPKAQQTPKKLIPLNQEDKEVFIRLKDIKDNIVDFINNGKNLYLCSDSPGNSKTSWGFKMMLKYIDSIWSGNGFRTRCLFIHVPTFLQQLKNFENPLSEEYKEKIKTCDLVFWDDIAASKLTDYEYNQLLAFIDARMLEDKSNIYTSNIVSKEMLETIIGGRLTSRIYGQSEVLTITADDMREGVK